MTQCPIKVCLLKEMENEIHCVHTQMKRAANTYGHTCCITHLHFPRGTVSSIFCVPSNVPFNVMMLIHVGYHRQTFSAMMHLQSFV
jgi:hypothetical protein